MTDAGCMEVWKNLLVLTEKRSLLHSVTCLNIRVLHRLCTEGNQSPKISHRAFQTCLYWKTYPNSCYVSLLTVFHLVYWEATVFILFLNTVCFLFSLFHTRERMCVSVCLSVCYLLTVAVHLSLWIPTSVFSPKRSAEHKYWSLHTWHGFPFLVYTQTDPPLPCWRGLWTALGQWGHLTCRIFYPHNLPLWERPSTWRGEESER